MTQATLERPVAEAHARTLNQTRERQIRPQLGPQEAFLQTPADIAIFGGAAGGGKTYALLLEATRHISIPNYYAVIFRRTSTQVRNEGGLWDESCDLYPHMRGRPRESALEWRFPSRASIRFAHLEYDKNRFDWQGAQIVMLGFDELTHFTKRQFWYMLSRCRTTCGVRPYIRATCNPDPDSFVYDLISWWIDPDTGFPIPERSGVLRYFIRREAKLEWADTPDVLAERHSEVDPRTDIKSLTFIHSSIHDNKILLDRDPEYIGNLRALSMVDRERLLHGNWKIRETAGTMFRREWFEIVNSVPRGTGRRTVRYWDRAATEKREDNDPAYTAGCFGSSCGDGVIYIEDVARFRSEALKVRTGIRNLAAQDTKSTEVWLEQDPGQAGKVEVADLIRALAGYDVHAKRATGSKVVRAKPASAQAEAGNIKLVRGKWNRDFLDELENFPDSKFKDQADAFTGAVSVLLSRGVPRVRIL